MKRVSIFCILICSVLLHNCTDFFGEQTDLAFIDEPQGEERDVAYVPIQPVISGFENPTDIIVGYDELLYVVDEGAEQLICFDLAGNRLSSLVVPGIRKIEQDRRLDLLAIGSTDTIIGDNQYNLTTLYRIALKNENYGLSNARITSKVVHPFYYKNGFEGSDAEVQFEGVAVLADNYYYVARSGPNNASEKFGGPDNAVLYFNDSDRFVTPVLVQTQTGLYNNFFDDPSAIRSFFVPPHNLNMAANGNFIYASTAADQPYKVGFIRKIENDGGVSYELAPPVAKDTTIASRTIDEPYRFEQPVGLSFANDGSNYIFVVDAEKDSLFQFTTDGYEGVRPPLGSSNAKKLIPASFGGTGIGLRQFNKPMAVAYHREMLFVADAGNRRILRFTLSSDIE